MCQVPGTDVVSGMAVNRVVWKKPRNKINPALICEQASGDMVPTEIMQTMGPPLRESSALSGVLHSEESKVEYAMPDFLVYMKPVGRAFAVWTQVEKPAELEAGETGAAIAFPGRLILDRISQLERAHRDDAGPTTHSP